MNAERPPGFWDWSLERYEVEGVAPRLLRLQDDFALNVNILLWCGWCAERSGELPEIALKKAMDLTGRWSGEIVSNLRTARRLLKTPPRQANGAAASALRKTVKDAELAAEKIEQDMLSALAADILTLDNNLADALMRCRRNLAAYAALAGAARREGFSVTLLEELAERIVPYADAAQSE